MRGPQQRSRRWRLRWALVGVSLAVVATSSTAAFAASASAAAAGDDAIEARYQALGGAAGVLGDPDPATPDPYDVPGVDGARARNFTGGRIYWSTSTGAWDVEPPVLTRVDALGGPAGALGLPTAAVTALSSPAGASVQPFTGGRFYLSDATGTRAVTGPVLMRYLALGGPTGVLGLPRSDETAVPGGSQQVFVHGRLYRSTTYGTHLLRGPVLDRYVALSGPAGRLGMPVHDVASLTPGWRGVFRHGRIYYSKASGAHVLDNGAILSRYLKIGATGSYVGFPTSDRRTVAAGYRNLFRFGSITYLTGTGHTQVHGAWRTRTERVTAAQIPYTYRSGCPVGPSALRRVYLPYYDWSGVPRFGKLIIRDWAADDMKRVFKRAFAARFPIRRMNPVDVYQGSDVVAMEHDNTSAFNCRKVTGNPYRLSQHSYGNAIDINTFENPYVTGSTVYPSGSGIYLNRSNARKGMITRRGSIASGMRAEGWLWGARWSHPDYQHFSSNGG
ncbi:MAG: hypothetical protein QOE01_3226 [Actinomycetota bacterium]|nr:hypothetical protein [Actinomycetota bacterium]